MISQEHLLILAISYSLLFLLLFVVSKMKCDDPVSERVVNGNWLLLHIRHAAGAFILAILPYPILADLQEKVFSWHCPGTLRVLTFIVTAILLTGPVIAGSAAINAPAMPGSRYSAINTSLHLLLRTIFVGCYEWFFRGIVLFSCLASFGAVRAIIINLVLTSLLHLCHGRKEFNGSILFGLMLCLFSIWWQSVWPAVLMHLLLCTSHEFYLLMAFSRKKETIIA
jgi:hypothetical protein